MREHDRIGPCVLLSLLARGARSQVWRASDAHGAELALKLVAPDDGAACARLRHEAAIMGRLDHPGVAACLGGGLDAGAAWLAMELLAPPPARLTLPLFRQLLQALAHVHERGVVHCDLKPANLLQGRGGALKLADFGIARLRGQGAAPAHGTPYYMAPEQLRGHAADGRTDLFAAGVILYQLLAGARPFEGSAFDVVQHILSGPSAAATGTVYDSVVQKALARDPVQRHASAGAFLYALDMVCQHA